MICSENERRVIQSHLTFVFFAKLIVNLTHILQVGMSSMEEKFAEQEEDWVSPLNVRDWPQIRFVGFGTARKKGCCGGIL